MKLLMALEQLLVLLKSSLFPRAWAGERLERYLSVSVLHVDDASALEYLVVVEHFEAFQSRVKDNLWGVIAIRGLSFDYVLIDFCLPLGHLHY